MGESKTLAIYFLIRLTKCPSSPILTTLMALGALLLLWMATLILVATPDRTSMRALLATSETRGIRHAIDVA